MLATEVWADEQQAGAFLFTLLELLRPVGLGDPQRVVFAVPDFFTVGYGAVQKRTRMSTAAQPVLLTPRAPAEAPLPTALANRESAGTIP